MKVFKTVLTILVVMALFWAITGCEYDVVEPQWEQEHENPPSPTITQFDPPDVAGAGVNVIKIIGENFSPEIDRNKVYFNNVSVDILSASASELVVRRPNIITDEATIKVISYDGLLIAEKSPYQITSVFDRFGSFIENIEISSISIDKNNTLYVTYGGTDRQVLKVTPDGTITSLGISSRLVTDSRVEPNGNVILMMNNRTIMQWNVTTNEEAEWYQSGKRVSYGDFDSNKNFLGAGRRTGIVSISPAMDEIVNSYFTADEITSLRVYNNAVYVIVNIASPDENNPEWGIWRLPITDAIGTLGEPVLVLDWTQTEYAESTLNSMTFDADGTMYIANSSEQPLLMYSPADGTIEPFYKDILPSSATKIVWGNENDLFMVLAAESEQSVLVVEMGAPGAPYFGRQ